MLVGVFFLTLLFSSRRRWLCRFEPWLALGLFGLVISPDVAHNLLNTPQGRPPTYANYLDHLSRFGGIGWNEYPTLFYFGACPRGWHIAHYDFVLNPFVAVIFLCRRGAGGVVREGRPHEAIPAVHVLDGLSFLQPGPAPRAAPGGGPPRCREHLLGRPHDPPRGLAGRDADHRHLQGDHERHETHEEKNRQPERV